MPHQLKRCTEPIKDYKESHVLQAKLQSAHAGSHAASHGKKTQSIQFELDFCAASAKMRQYAGLTPFTLNSSNLRDQKSVIGSVGLRNVNN